MKDSERAFIERAKKNFAAAGRQWTKGIQHAVLKILPNRRNDVTQILQEASTAP